MWGTVVAILAVALIAGYVALIFLFDYRRRKKGAPSIFLDVCEEEGKGKRLIREYHKKYPKKG